MGILYDYTRLAGTSKWVFCTITLDWLVQVNELFLGREINKPEDDEELPLYSWQQYQGYIPLLLPERQHLKCFEFNTRLTG